MPPSRACPQSGTVLLEPAVAPGVTRIVVRRSEKRNAQDTATLYALNDAFDWAARDEGTAVIVVAAEGPHFSAGHDLSERDLRALYDERERVGTWSTSGAGGAEDQLALEKEIYLGFSERWRSIPKVTIAAVQGAVVSGGLMLAWPCDLIVAAEDAYFVDNTVSLGVCGAEFFNHPWELPARKVKEMLFTSAAITAQDALQLGMVNRVVPRDQLEEATLALAEQIARQPKLALRLAKELVNSCQDAQGRVAGQATAFALHQLCHTHNLHRYGSLIEPRS